MDDGMGHYTMENMGATLRFEMPSQKNWLNIALYAILLALFAPLGVLLTIGFVRNGGIPSIDASSNLTLVFYGLLQAVIFLDFIVEGAWQLAGREVVEIDDDHIRLRHQIFGVGFTKKYAADKIGGIYLRVSKKQFWLFSIDKESIKRLYLQTGEHRYRSWQEFIRDGKIRTLRLDPG